MAKLTLLDAIRQGLDRYNWGQGELYVNNSNGCYACALGAAGLIAGIIDPATHYYNDYGPLQDAFGLTDKQACSIFFLNDESRTPEEAFKRIKEYVESTGKDFYTTV